MSGRIGRMLGGLALSLAAVSFSGQSLAAEFRLGHVFAPASPVGQAAEAFAAEVTARTGGNVTIKVFPAGQIGNDEQLVRDVSRGLLDFSFVNYGSATGIKRQIDFGALPYIATSYDQVDRIFYGEGVVARVASEMLAELNVRTLGWYEQEFRAVSNSRRAVERVADLDGLKLRVPPAPSLTALFQAAGVQTVTMSITELFSGLQQGTVDGQENGPIQTFTAKLYETTPHMTLTNHSFVAGAIVVAERLAAELSPDDLAIVEAVAEEVGNAQRQQARETYKTSIEGLKADGVQVVELSAEEMQKLRELGVGVWEELSDIYGQELLDELRQAGETTN